MAAVNLGLLRGAGPPYTVSFVGEGLLEFPARISPAAAATVESSCAHLSRARRETLRTSFEGKGSGICASIRNDQGLSMSIET
jgi:hypothetical protein